MKRFRPGFRPGWKLSIFALVFLPLLISLGFWQLSRAAEKRGLIEEFMQAVSALPSDADTLQHDELSNFQRVRLRGSFGNETFLLDNQVHKGRIGYWVVQILHTANAQVLVNRGFVPAPAMRDELPMVTAPNGEVTVVAVVWPDTGLPPIWAEDSWQTDWPLRIQRMDTKKMAELTGAWPVEFRLEAGQPGVFAAAPLATTLDEDKHNGYAATWFGLAVTLFAGYIVAGWRQAQEV